VPEYKRILVIRLSSLGDIILTTPFLKVLREKFPNAQTDYLTKSEYADIIKYNPNIHKVIEVDNIINFKGLRELKKQLQANSYDLIADLHNNLRTFYLRLFFGGGVKFLKFKKYSLRKFLLVKFKINLLRNFPAIAQRYILTLNKLLGIESLNLNHPPEIFTSAEEVKKAGSTLNGLTIPAGTKLICIVPGAKHFTKTYPAEYYAELINKFDNTKYSFLLVGRGNDKKNIDSIISSTGANVYDLCDKLSLLELTELMKKCDLVISGDTGPMHIAEAAGAALIMLAGSSVREFGFYPQTKNSSVIENNGLKCRPCSHIGRPSCPQGHFKCTREIKSEKILPIIPRLLI
jgi:lipopolysaccharide heptosyltransferase II